MRLDKYLGVLSLIQRQLCEVDLWRGSEVKQIGKRLRESGRNKLSVQNRVLRALFLLPNELERAMSNATCI